MQFSVRLMQLDEVGIRTEYFHSASSEFLQRLGVDRALIPSRAEWRRFYEEDYVRPLEQRTGVQLVWLGDDKIIGFSSADHIQSGKDAKMHLHILDSANRHHGYGAECVRKSAALYFELLALKRLYCEPNAFNTAPNRTLQKAGFKFLKTYMTVPGSLNFHQAVNRWVLEKK